MASTGKTIRVTSGNRYDPELHPSVEQDSQNSTFTIGCNFCCNLQLSDVTFSLSKKQLREKTRIPLAAEVKFKLLLKIHPFEVNCNFKHSLFVINFWQTGRMMKFNFRMDKGIVLQSWRKWVRSTSFSFEGSNVSAQFPPSNELHWKHFNAAPEEIEIDWDN